MSADDLSKLRIDRALAPRQTRRRRARWWMIALAVLVAAAGVWYVMVPRATAVQTTPIVTTYPSQQFVVLNSSGYVVAQRKAAIASKASGRLEWLGVTEGSRVKAGDVIARLDARDVAAQLDSAQRQRRGRAGRDRAGGSREPRCRRIAKRERRTCSSRSSSRSRRSTGEGARRSRGRRRRQRASRLRRRAGERAQRAGRRRLHADPRAFRRHHPVQERQCRRYGDAVLVGGGLEGRGGDHGRHEHARSRGRRVRVEPCRRSRVGQPCEITLDALPDARFRGTRIAHRADRRPRQGDGDDQGAIRHDRSRASCRK